MGAIQNSINQSLGTAATALTINKHIKQQEKSNKLGEASIQGDLAMAEEANLSGQEKQRELGTVLKTKQGEVKAGKEAIKEAEQMQLTTENEGEWNAAQGKADKAREKMAPLKYDIKQLKKSLGLVKRQQAARQLQIQSYRAVLGLKEEGGAK